MPNVCELCGNVQIDEREEGTTAEMSVEVLHVCEECRNERWGE